MPAVTWIPSGTDSAVASYARYLRDQRVNNEIILLRLI